jgi:AcrR family transcriptional regulator
MQSSTAQTRHRIEQRDTILKEARDLFVEVGYEKFSMRRLARRIGCSPTTIYIYFNDKRALILSLCEELFERYLAELKRLARQENDPLERLRLAFLFWLRFGIDNPEHYRIVFYTYPAIYGTPEEFMARDSLARRAYVLQRKIVSDCIMAGAFRPMDPDVATQAIWAAVHGVISVTIFTEDFPLHPPEALVDVLLDGLLKGFAPNMAASQAG